MQAKLLLCASLLLTTVLANADVLIVGTPANSLLAKPTGPSPKLTNLINFDNLTPTCSIYTFPCTSPSPTTMSFSGGVTISSPDGLAVIPYSTQSAPNELYDTSSDGSADITIGLNQGVGAIGIGIADSDTINPSSFTPVSITLQALGLGGVDLGSPFAVTIPETTANPGNGYFVLADNTSDIYGLQILAPATDESGLAIDDLQYTPEPGSIVLLTSGIAFLGSFRLRKRA